MKATQGASSRAGEEVGTIGQSPRRPRRVAHLTSVHSAFDIRIFEKECRSLAKAGYEVILIAPHGSAETIDGVRIEPVTRRRRRRDRMTSMVMDIFRKAVDSEAEIYHFHDPELLPVGVLLKAAGKHVIYDAHEHLAKDILAKRWIHGSLRKAVSAMASSIEKLAVLQFDAVVAATPGIAERFPKRKTSLVQNFPKLDEFLAYHPVPPYCERDYRGIYVGSAEVSRGAVEMIAAAKLLPDRFGAKLTFVGGVDPPEFKREMTARRGWERIDHVGFQQRTELVRYVVNARLGLVVLHPTPGFLDSQPVKLFEYMAAGIPVVASNFPDWRRFVDEIGCGISVNPLDPQEIAEAITWLFDHPLEAESMGIRGQAAVRSTYNWDTEARNLLRLYERVLPRNS